VIIMSTRENLRVPIQTASKRGVSWLNETAGERRVFLTKFGRVASVVDSAERLDETVEKVDIAAREVVESFADLAASRSSTWSLEEACAKVGIDADLVRERARRLP
jgi:hypothetical protein